MNPWLLFVQTLRSFSGKMNENKKFNFKKCIICALGFGHVNIMPWFRLQCGCGILTSSSEKRLETPNFT